MAQRWSLCVVWLMDISLNCETFVCFLSGSSHVDARHSRTWLLLSEDFEPEHDLGGGQELLPGTAWQKKKAKTWGQRVTEDFTMQPLATWIICLI